MLHLPLFIKKLRKTAIENQVEFRFGDGFKGLLYNKEHRICGIVTEKGEKIRARLVVDVSTSWPYYKGWIAPQHHANGAIIGVGANLSFVTDGFLVIGDAACLTKPMNGEGIPSAWVQCTPAADVVIKGMRLEKHYKNYPETPEGYRKWEKKALRLWKQAGSMADTVKDA